jgi:CubicO group peptidase (beta-lactamase class C family)
MITRRVVLQAAMQGLVAGAGTAMAQQEGSKGVARKKGGNEQTPVRADKRLNRVLAPIRDEHHLPGLIGAILRGGRLVGIGAVGIRKIGSPEPMRVTDKVHLGSCTKAMTATLAGMLVDDGKLTWGSTIGEVFPDLAVHVHAEFQTVTLHHLLTHRAGLPFNVGWWDLPGQTPTEQRLAIVATALEGPPLHRPGSTYLYSNVGYALAGLMAEKVTGESWENLMRQRLFGPLEMASAGFGSPGRPETVEQPWGHHAVGGQIEPTLEDNATSMGPAGIVHCSIPDWSRFAALHLAAARGRPRLLRAETFRVLHTPRTGADYAGGWVVCQRTWASGRALTHTGTNKAWNAMIWLAPALNLAFLSATNQGDEVAGTGDDEAIAALIRASESLS